jgi:hypothetical protein
MTIRLLDMIKNKEFVKEFKSEFELDKFRRKLRYSTKLIEIKEWK